MNKSSLLCNRMIMMSLDVSKDHVLRKIMNNLNWSGKDTNAFCLLYIAWYFIFVNVSKYRYCSKVRHIICILKKQQYHPII